MPKHIQNLKVRLDENLDEKLRLLEPSFSSYRILRKSIDARKRNELHEIYSLDVFYEGEDATLPSYPVDKVSYNGRPVLIIGSGPAGLFAALRLVERGVKCVLLERGAPANERMIKINRYWRYGELDLDNNVCFGEGGAGLYSDGKLITRIKSPYIPYVMHRLVEFGAPEEIQYLANPHVGSDRIRRVIPKMRDYLLANGCEIHFNTRVNEILVDQSGTRPKVCGVVSSDGRKFEADDIILATGHSANDMFYHLRDLGVAMEGKSFAVGLRVEHPQEVVNKIQYRDFAGHPKLGAANYRLAYHDKEANVGVYSFCMCPGGYVLASSTDPETVVSNGMSNYHRNSPFANSAVVVSVDYEENFGTDFMNGLEWRSNLERKAFAAVRAAGGSKQLPAQRLVDFIDGRLGSLNEKNSSPSDGIAIRVDKLLPSWLRDRLIEGFLNFDQTMKGFVREDAQVFGVETRTSCPIRISRHEDRLEACDLESRGLPDGVYGAGFGADGVRGSRGSDGAAAVGAVKVRGRESSGSRGSNGVREASFGADCKVRDGSSRRVEAHPSEFNSLESLSHAGLYPCGEGAGYAGGITSAAVDGIRVVEAILRKHGCL